jgi:hypothetical protein
LRNFLAILFNSALLITVGAIWGKDAVDVTLVIMILALGILVYGWWKAKGAYWRGFYNGRNMPPTHYNVRCLRIMDERKEDSQ